LNVEKGWRNDGAAQSSELATMAARELGFGAEKAAAAGLGSRGCGRMLFIGRMGLLGVRARPSAELGLESEPCTGRKTSPTGGARLSAAERRGGRELGWGGGVVPGGLGSRIRKTRRKKRGFLGWARLRDRVRERFYIF